MSNASARARKIYFISDAHVGTGNIEQETLKENKLSDFLLAIGREDPKPLLYIVGDLFDFWFEYRYAIPALYQKLLSRLVFLRDQGVDIRYVTGNHDFWMGRFFPKMLQIPVYRGVHRLELTGRRFYIFHGDGVLAEDRGYRLLKKILQNPAAIQAYKLLHPDLGIPLARWASSSSRNHYRKSPEEERRDDAQYIRYAVQVLEQGYDFVIMGHTHRPVLYRHKKGLYVNLGDWMRHFTFARFDGKDLRLFRWESPGVEIEIQEQSPLPEVE